MVQVGMGENDRIELGERVDLRNVQVRGAVLVVRFLTAVYEHFAVRGREEKCCPAYFPATAEHGDPEPLVPLHGILALFPTGNIAVNAPADCPQELLSFLIDRAEVLPHLLDRAALDWGSPDYFRGPADIPGDIPQGSPVLADNNAGFFRLD